MCQCLPPPQIRELSLKLYQRGAELAAQRGLLFLDTKYEFGTDAVCPRPLSFSFLHCRNNRSAPYHCTPLQGDTSNDRRVRASKINSRACAEWRHTPFRPDGRPVPLLSSSYFFAYCCTHYTSIIIQKSIKTKASFHCLYKPNPHSNPMFA